MPSRKLRSIAARVVQGPGLTFFGSALAGSGAVPRLLGAVGVGLLGVSLAGCVRLTPFEAVRQKLPSERFVQLGDQVVHVEQWGSGEPLLLLHGFGGSTFCWRRVGPELGRHFWVVAVDLNGFGWTQRVKAPEAYTLAGQTRMVLKVMDALGIAKAHVLGHSYGGGVALGLAATAPQQVASLILVDAAVPSGPSRARARWVFLRPVGTLMLRTVFLRKSFIRKGLERSVFDRSVVTDVMVEGYWERLKVEGVAEAYRGFTSSPQGEALKLDLAEIRQPTLVIWGLEDKLVPVSTGSALAKKLPSARFVGLERCGHLPMEEQPEAFVAVVRSFLEGAESNAEPEAPPPGSTPAR